MVYNQPERARLNSYIATLFLKRGHLVFIRNIAEFFFDVPDSLPVIGGAQVVTLLGQQLHQVILNIATPHLDRLDAVIQWVTLIYWHTVCDSMA